ncbi:hypothetical protein ACFY0N_38500 [Streptomyces vinaceus]|uniref:hypothetical protein n=1 Tax=Streptomyces vinaceus TaxID=1960 RepID=UPI0036841254
MRSRTVANRMVLALAGTALLVAATVAARGAENQLVHAALGHVRRSAPGSQILAGCLTLAASVVLLTAQIPRRAPRRLRLPAPGCHLDSRAVGRAVRTQCSTLSGVVRARCRLTGRGNTMSLAITLTVDSTAHPADLLAAVSDGVLPQIAALLTPRRLETRIRLHVQRPRPHRAS